MKSPSSRGQRGGFIIGMVVGLLIGLAIALGVALYVTKAPVPFVNKVPARPPGQEAAEAERNRNWDPNSPLAGRNPAPGTAASGVVGGPDPATAGRPAVLPPPVEPAVPAASDARVARPPALTASAPAVVRAPTPRASQPASAAALAGGPFTYFVQAGAYSRSEDAEQQRAKLAMLGIESRLTERDQGGRMVYRVRVGPFERREDAEIAKEKLGDSGVDSALVAVQK